MIKAIVEGDVEATTFSRTNQKKTKRIFIKSLERNGDNKKLSTKHFDMRRISFNLIFLPDEQIFIIENYDRTMPTVFIQQIPHQ